MLPCRTTRAIQPKCDPVMRRYAVTDAGTSRPPTGKHLRLLRPRAPGLDFRLDISVRSTLRMRALRAKVKPAHCKFKGRTLSANFSPLLTQQTPVFFLQLTTLALGRCQRLLNRFPYGHLHMKQQPRYAFSTVNRTLYNGRVARL